MIDPLRALRGRWLEAELAAGASLSDADRRRRRITAAVTLVVGAATLAWSLRLPPADPMFLPSTLVLAAVWTIGAVACGRPLRAEGRPFARRALPELGLGLAAGTVLLLVFLAGASLVADVAVLRDPVQQLLAHAHWGALVPVLGVAVLNGIVEEVFFRGALHDAVAGRLAPLLTTLAYTLVTACAGVVLLAFAALVLGAACSAMRRVTGALIAPIACHLTWSIGMILVLEPTLNWWR